MQTLTRKQVREVDRRAIQEYGMSGLVLMENAGRGVADVICKLLGDASASTPQVTIVCGKGNNGGDGFAIARHLDLRGIGVKVLLLADPHELAGDAAANYSIIEKANLDYYWTKGPINRAVFEASLAGSNILVDAILGTGATGEPKLPLAEAIDMMNATRKPIVAVDIPSGLDCETGAAAAHTIRAAHTCTFVAAKPGFFVPSANEFVGEIHVCDIGVPRQLVEEIASGGMP
jgi:NAD(P)H-hydrate epimerase